MPHPTHAYRVTVDNFLAAGGDAFTVLSRGTQPLVGGTDMDALTGYLSTAYAPGKPPYDPHDPRLAHPPKSPGCLEFGATGGFRGGCSR